MKANTNRPLQFAIASAAAIFLLAAPAAEAHGHRCGGDSRGMGFGGGGGGHGGGFGRGMGRGMGHGKGMGKMRCMGKLFRAPLQVLQTRLGLNAQQLAKVEKIRDNFAEKRITGHADLSRARLKMRKLMQQDQPKEAQVLKAMRKARHIRGTLREERVKATLWLLRTLSAEQRATLRKGCLEGRRGFRGGEGRWGKNRGNRRGMGHGYGRRGMSAVQADGQLGTALARR